MKKRGTARLNLRMVNTNYPPKPLNRKFTNNSVEIKTLMGSLHHTHQARCPLGTSEISLRNLIIEKSVIEV